MSTPLEPRTDGGAHPAPRRQGIDCNEAGDLIPALALGPIEPAERLLLLAHCETCPACAASLESARAVTALLPFATPLSSPSAGAKSSLFAKIASTSAATAALVNAPASPIVDSPLAKRSPIREKQPGDQSKLVSGASPAWFNSQFTKIAAAPLAIALVLVGLYAFQTAGGSGEGNGSATQVAQATLVSSAASSAPTVPVSQASLPDIASKNKPATDESTFADTAIDTPVSTEGFTTQFMSAQPLYAMSARTNGSSTESARSIAPNDGICRLSSLKPGQYQLSLSGVDLPGGAGVAGIFLATKQGDQLPIGKITIDQYGNGQATFSLEQPMSNYVALLIGPIDPSKGRALPLKQVATFSLSSSDQFSTIGNIAST